MTIETTTITLADIKSIYSGRHGCTCGCRGKHTKVEDNAATVKLIVNKMNKLGAIAEDNHFYVETETRLYIAYKS